MAIPLILVASAIAIAIAIAIATACLYRINLAMKVVPEAARKASPCRWTRQEIRDTYSRVKQSPILFAKHLPPRLDRRYIVVGGSDLNQSLSYMNGALGLVGGVIVLQLRQRGQSPDSIRILDFQQLNRRDMVSTAAGCDFVKTDITSAASAAGANVFIATSSSSVSVVPANYWIWPWQTESKNYVQIINELDFDAPIRANDLFFSNYARSKAVAERLVYGNNQHGFRTGVLRPGNGLYGQKSDPCIDLSLRTGGVTWMPNVVQNLGSSRNIALAHLQFEAALAQKKMPLAAGKPLIVTDPGPPPSHQDIYNALIDLSESPITLSLPPPSTASRFNVCMHTVIDDSKARRSIKDGGIAYRGVCTTLDGVCEQVVDRNRYDAGKPEGTNGNSITDKAAKMAGLGSVPVAA
ncbi:hypothetical protein B0H63DRAFT_517761 [Podospora didyma]|uniref:Uncharacterized protein n=1 Tax=Podospora didyma TaxID=330526 RepID=A0AAE0U8A0_9PEZI|nr:hypothetical protein B0H63DRAFT_517761 [Podospora didyma]